jgi:hypothetical protein
LAGVAAFMRVWRAMKNEGEVQADVRVGRCSWRVV